MGFINPTTICKAIRSNAELPFPIFNILILKKILWEEVFEGLAKLIPDSNLLSSEAVGDKYKIVGVNFAT